jgi:hypothetical protein
MLKKSEKDPLLLICNIGKDIGEKSLGSIDKMIVLGNLNINYNFFIIPVTNSEVFKVIEGNGGLPIFSSPKTFDYTKESSVHLFLAGERLDDIQGISMNIDNGNFSCVYAKKFKQCDVPKSHFDGKTDGDYYFYYTNKQGEKVRLYELSPAKVILSGKGNNSIWINKASLLLFALLCLLF